MSLWVWLCGCGLVGVGWLVWVGWCGLLGVAMWVWVGWCGVALWV